MNIASLRTLLPVLTFALAFGSGAKAGVITIYDNLNSTTESSDTLGPLFDSFSTPGSPFSLTDVMIKLYGPETPAAGTLEVALFADDSTSPGTLLTSINTLDAASVSAGDANYDFPLTSPYALATNTRYWIGINISVAPAADSTIEVDYSYDTTATGVAGEYFANEGGVFSNDGGPYQMRITGTSDVPEPSSFILSAFGVAGFGVLRRRRRYATPPATIPAPEGR